MEHLKELLVEHQLELLLERLVVPQSESRTMCTFHSFCAMLLRREGSYLNLSSNYTIYDAEDQLSAIKQALELSELDPKRNPPQAVRSVISKAKCVLQNSQTFAKQAGTYFEEACARVYHHYEEILSRNSAVDFDDLLMKAVILLQEFPQVREDYQRRHQYLMVDEFQDTNRMQWDLVSLLVKSWGEGDGLANEGPLAPSIFIVGDRKQSIYRFRDADVSILQDATDKIALLRGPETEQGRQDVRQNIAHTNRENHPAVAETMWATVRVRIAHLPHSRHTIC